MKKQSLNERAARALDATLKLDDRGPRTHQTRARVAAALDASERPAALDVEWLELVAMADPEVDQQRLAREADKRDRRAAARAGIVWPRRRLRR